MMAENRKAASFFIAAVLAVALVCIVVGRRRHIAPSQPLGAQNATASADSMGKPPEP